MILAITIPERLLSLPCSFRFISISESRSASATTSSVPSNTLNYSEEPGTRQEELIPRVRPRHLATAVWPLIFPTTLFCFLIFGFHPVLSQFVNQVRT